MNITKLEVYDEKLKRMDGSMLKKTLEMDE